MSFRKFRKKTEEGVGSAAPVAVLKASSAALPDSLCLISWELSIGGFTSI